MNGLLAVIKALAGYFGNAYVLIADAVESLTDVFGSLVVWLGLRVAAEPANADYPYGRGRAESLAAAIVAIMLFIAAGGIAYESIQQIRTPHRAPAPFTLIVLIVVVLAKESLFRLAMHVGVGIASSAVQAEAWHHRSDAITSLAAFVGICVALVGGPGYETADDWAALIAAAVILINGYNIGLSALGEILDRAPDTEIEQEVRRLAQSVPGVDGTHKCLIRKLGLDYYVDLDLRVDGQMTVEISHQLAHDVQNVIRQGLPFITKVLIHVEPTRQSVGESASDGERKEGG